MSIEICFGPDPFITSRSANRIGSKIVLAIISRVVVRCPDSQIRYRVNSAPSLVRVRRTVVGNPHCGHRNAAAFTFGIESPPVARDVRCMPPRRSRVLARRLS